MSFCRKHRAGLPMLIVIGALVCGSRTAQGQLTRGFEATAPVRPTGEELTEQPDLWIMEVTIKPMRMIPVELTDAETGSKRREFVWYLVYKAVNRPLKRNEAGPDAVPVNEEDPIPAEPLFVPEFTLITEDEGQRQIFRDTIIPEAEAVIRKRERMDLKNSVDVVQPIPQPTPEGETPQDVIYGLAMWRGIDPETDRFTVLMSGFSNGYQVETVGSGKVIIQRTIRQQFWRPGDVFDQNETEFRLEGEPEWDYPAELAELPPENGASASADAADTGAKPPTPTRQ